MLAGYCGLCRIAPLEPKLHRLLAPSPQPPAKLVAAPLFCTAQDAPFHLRILGPPKVNASRFDLIYSRGCLATGSVATQADPSSAAER